MIERSGSPVFVTYSHDYHRTSVKDKHYPFSDVKFHIYRYISFCGDDKNQLRAISLVGFNGTSGDCKTCSNALSHATCQLPRIVINVDPCLELYETRIPKDKVNVVMAERNYSAKIHNVNKALDLLRSRQAGPAAKKHKKITSNIDDRTILHCCSSKLHNIRSRKRKKVTSSGFSRTLITIEMRKCLMRHDWPHVAELLPLLLDGRIETEPIIWKYLITELFYSPKSNSEMLDHFIKMIVCSQTSEFLKKVLTLPSQAEDSDST